MSDDKRLLKVILDLTNARGGDKTICPSEVARHLVGENEREWRALMGPIRAQAVQLAKSGAVEIRKKGSVMDPDNFSGVYRIRISNS